MPVSFSSPARNLFLLGSSGADVVTNFFKTIDQSAGTDGVYLPDEIKFNYSDEKFILAGSASDSNSKGFGWFEKRDDAGTADFENRIESTQSGVDTTLRAMELDSSNNLIVVGKTGTVPWIAKYSNGGVIDWQSTTNSSDLEYTGITSDSNGQYYACGKTAPPSGGGPWDTQAFVEKFDANGNPGWGKSAFMLGRDVLLNKIAANSRGEVVAVGYLNDLNSVNGYIVKIDTNTGEVLWDRTLEGGAQFTTAYCNDVFIDDNDQIYIVGLYDDGFGGRGFIVKYSPEGNIIWQRQTPVTYPGEIVYYGVKSDSETQQTIVFGEYGDPGSNNRGGILSKYSKDGSLVWRRTIFSSYNNSDTFSNVSLDADPSFYYLLYIDDAISGFNGTPESYTFGKVSSSGNGLGAFQYAEGTGETIDYEILNVADEIGRLSDGSVRNDISDLITYPFNANKLLFDDLATQVSNKKRQMDSADSFEYSGSPAIRVADFVELDLGDESFDVNVPAAEEIYDEAGTYTFTVPAGVTEVSAVVVGSGGGAASSPGTNTSSAGGGGGGGLAYGTFTVTPGEDLTIVVGNFGVGGASGTTAGTAGGSTTISRGATVLLEGGGGAGGQADAPIANSSFGSSASGGTSSGTERDGGGTGGNGGHARYNWGGGGGGGAGGYTGNGGNGGSGNTGDTNASGVSGSGGGGGGGGGIQASVTQNNGGGGVGIFGGPINGAGGSNGNPGGGGSNGQGGQPGGKGGKFGGGGGGAEDDTNSPGGDGGIGGARIIWGAGRSFPNSAAQDFSSVETRVRDKSGKGNNGVVNRATLNAAGYWEFSGTDTEIIFGPKCNTLFEDGGSGTIEMWVRLNDVTTRQTLCSGYLSSGSTQPDRWDFEVSTSLLRGGSHDNSFFTGTTTLSTATWYHFVFTLDKSSGNGTLKAYVNTALDTTQNFTLDRDWATDVEFGIGNRYLQQYDFPLNGDIGEVRVYPRVLTTAQIFQNYNATKSKYTGEAPDTAPKIGPGIVYDSNLLLNYDFGNRATYDSVGNLIRWSEDLTNSVWQVSDNNQPANESNVTTAPDGTESADRVNRTTNNQVWYQITNQGVGTYTWSCYAKADTLTEFTLASTVSFQGQGVVFNLSNGTAGSPQNYNNGPIADISLSNPTIEDVGNGWYKCSVQVDLTLQNRAIHFEAGDFSTTTAGSVFIWGAQLTTGTGYVKYTKTENIFYKNPTTVKNLSGTSIDGTINLAPYNGGGWFEFDGGLDSGTRIAFNSSTIDLSGSFSIDMWFRQGAQTNDYWMLLGAQGYGGAGNGIGHYLYADHIRTWAQDTTGSNTTINLWNSDGTVNFTAGVWYNLILTRESGTAWRWYLNGSLVNSNTNDFLTVDFTTPNTYIGDHYNDTTWQYDGDIAEVRMYSRALTATEASQNFNATRSKYGV